MCFTNINSSNVHFRDGETEAQEKHKTASTVPGTQQAIYHGLLTLEPGTDRSLSIQGH